MQLHLIKKIKKTDEVKISGTASEFPSDDQAGRKTLKNKQKQNACALVITFREHKIFYEMVISLNSEENCKGRK